jgi:hypothetical protein
MPPFDKLAAFSAFVLLLGASAAIASSNNQNKELNRERLSCEIQEEQERGGITLRGYVSANATVSGSYQLRVINSSNGGSVNLQQNGDFRVAPKQSVLLGQITLGSRTPNYDATLRLIVDGKTVTCSGPAIRSL